MTFPVVAMKSYWKNYQTPIEPMMDADIIFMLAKNCGLILCENETVHTPAGGGRMSGLNNFSSGGGVSRRLNCPPPIVETLGWMYFPRPDSYREGQ